MLKYPIMFWTMAAVIVLWCGHVMVYGLVSSHYNPMASLGDRLHELRTWSISIPILVSLSMFVIWLRCRPLPKRTYLRGMIPLGLIAILTIVPPIDSRYEQSYFLGDQRHNIPWSYSPYNGQPQIGGTYFLVRVRDWEFTPHYQGKGDRIIIGKAVDFNYGKGGAAPENNCTINKPHFRCEWKTGAYVYFYSLQADRAPQYPEALFRPIEILMDSFETDAS